MASIRTNGPAVRAAIARLPDALNLRGHSALSATSLGSDILLRIAWAIRLRTLQEQTDPSGRPLAKLNRRYRAWKIRKGFDPRISIKTGKMLGLGEILGRTTITRDEASMTYGRSAAEIQKAEWVTEGSVRKNRPARPFYDLGADGARAVESQIDAFLDLYLRGG